MYTEKTHQESPSRTIQSKPGGGRVYREDNRPEAVRQAKFINAIQAKSAPRNVIQRANEGKDNDKGNVTVADIPEEDMQMDVSKGEHNTTNATLHVGEHDYTGQLKHYMVVKNGTQYQFPVKHLKIPTLVDDQWWRPNAGREDKVRGRQPEGFGGNQDWTLGDDIDSGKMSLFDSRSATLAHEYREEARRDDEMGFNIERSKLFHTQWGNPRDPHHIVGTLSIASTGPHIELKSVHHPEDKVEERGMAEMAGTIVIDCYNLVSGGLIGDDLEVAIGNLIAQQRDALFPEQHLDNPFAHQGGILAHLVGLVAEDIIAQRQLKESSSSSTPSSGIEEIIEDSESFSEGRGKMEIGSEEESAEEMDVVEKVPELSSLEHEREEEDVEEDSKKESQTDDASEERPEHSQSRGWFSTILGAPWRWIKRLFSN